MASTPARGSRPPSALRTTLASPLYRGSTIALLIAGIGASAAAPQIARFLVEQLHASLTVAGLNYLTNLTAPVAGYLIGSRSDRTGNRLGLFRLCTLIGFAGWGLIAVSTQVWQPFAISAVLLGIAGAGASQLFAAIHDDLAARQVAGADGVVSLVRMALTAGWVIGPVLGAFLAATSGLRTMLLLTAVTFLLQLLPLGTLREPRRVPSASDGADEDAHATAPRPGVRAMLPLLAFTGLYVLV